MDLQPFHRLLGIVGHPLGHSLSPLLHNWAAATLGLKQVYLAWDKNAEDLPKFIEAVRVLPIHGLSVTIPHKEKVLGLVDKTTDRVQVVGAANTLYWRDGELWAENTDVQGFLAPLQGQCFASALVLGSGGAARAVLAGLKEMEIGEVYVTNRTAERAEELAEEFCAKAVPWDERADVEAELVVNTTPLGLAGKDEGQTPMEVFRPGQTAYDLVYNPLETAFLLAAKRAGARTIGGLEMFVGQAAGQHALWLPEGPGMPCEEARRLLAGALKFQST